MTVIMMKQLLFFIVITVIASCGQNEPLTNYEPKSPQEQALKSILLDFQDGVNTLDAKKIKTLIHPKASLMTGRERKTLSKEEYVKILPKRLAGNPSIALGKPKMTVSGDKAEVKIYMTRGNYNGLVVYNMILEDNKWYIQGWKY
jgi:transcriptional regulator with PAS, ATPase and Fis domain